MAEVILKDDEEVSLCGDLKSVSFQEDGLVDATNESSPIVYGTEERKAVWYSKKEIAMIADKNKRLVKEYRRNGSPSLDMDHHATALMNCEEQAERCIRGLEDSVSVERAMALRARKNAVRQAVLCEQQRQRYEGVWDPSRIRKKSLRASKESRKLAYDLGKNDERCVFGSSRDNDCCPTTPVKSRRSPVPPQRGSTQLSIDRSSKTIVVDSPKLYKKEMKSESPLKTKRPLTPMTPKASQRSLQSPCSIDRDSKVKLMESSQVSLKDTIEDFHFHTPIKIRSSHRRVSDYMESPRSPALHFSMEEDTRMMADDNSQRSWKKASSFHSPSPGKLGRNAIPRDTTCKESPRSPFSQLELDHARTMAEDSLHTYRNRSQRSVSVQLGLSPIKHKRTMRSINVEIPPSPACADSPMQYRKKALRLKSNRATACDVSSPENPLVSPSTPKTNNTRIDPATRQQLMDGLRVAPLIPPTPLCVEPQMNFI